MRTPKFYRERAKALREAGNFYLAGMMDAAARQARRKEDSRRRRKQLRNGG